MSRRISSISNYISKAISEETLNSLARESGFVKRTPRKLLPKELINTLFFSNAGSKSSLEEYGVDYKLNTGIEVSKQAIDKRLNGNTRAFLKLLVEKALQSSFSRVRDSTERMKKFSEIRIMDSTEFVLPSKLADHFPGFGGVGREAMAQIQFEYDLCSNRIYRMELGKGTDSDITKGMEGLERIQPGALVLRDMAYVSVDYYNKLNERGVYFVSRLKPQAAIYEEVDGSLQRLRLDDIIARIEKSSRRCLDIHVKIGSYNKVPVRIVATLMPKEKVTQRITKKEQKHGRKRVSQQSKLRSRLSIMVTNIEDEISSSKVYELYRLRWQIELIFKSWKSLINIHHFNPVNSVRFECEIYIKLLWVILNWSIISIFSMEDSPELSLYKTTTAIINHSYILRSTLACSDKLKLWLWHLYEVSIIYNKKEYKKGRPKIGNILSI